MTKNNVTCGIRGSQWGDDEDYSVERNDDNFVLWTYDIALEQPAYFIFCVLEKQNYAIRIETEG
jgi:hypothetical protein